VSLTLRNLTPVADQLRPAATEDERIWFRKKRQAALARTMVLTAGMSGIYYVGSLLNDGQRASNVISLVCLGMLALIEAGMVIYTLSSGDLTKEIRAKRSAMFDEQRKQSFLAALDDEVPAD
jgi:hypothetical protein